MAQRWQKAGCWSILMAPVFAAGVVLLYAAGEQFRKELGLEPAFLFLVCLLAALFLVGIAGFMVWWRALRGPAPPPADTVAPRAGHYRPEAGPAKGAVSPGRAGRTRIHVEAWEPGRVLRLRQAPSWSVPAAAIALGVVLAVFVVVPSLENQAFYGGDIVVGVPDAAVLVMGTWAFLGFFWLGLPSLPRTVTVDWGPDAVEIGYGRRRRRLGLSRVRAIELRRRVSSIVDPETRTRRATTHTLQLIAWIEPEGREPVAFLLVETGPERVGRANEVQRELEPLAEGLAAALGVPSARPEAAPWAEPHP